MKNASFFVLSTLSPVPDPFSRDDDLLLLLLPLLLLLTGGLRPR
jgi:hypothetical protein